jgi:zinc protease
VKAPIDAARVKAIQDHLRYTLILKLETPAAIAGAVARVAGVLGDPSALEQLQKRIAALKPAELAAFTKTYLTDVGRTTLVFEAPAATGGAK